jgi:opacity protein-like surface antigen
MFHKTVAASLLVLVVMAGVAAPASAQQTITLQIGAFLPKGEDGRVSGDVLAINHQYLLFDFGGFNGFQVGGDWSFALGEFFEAGAGFGYYQQTVPAVYADWVNEDGSEIMQELRLRIMPATALVRILPLGSRSAFQPYVGAGVGIYFWRYSETGEFVDGYDGSIFRDSFEQSGTSVGPVAVFGLRGRVSPAALIGIEGRYQWGQGNLSQDFLGDKIDLGGLSILGTFGYRW